MYGGTCINIACIPTKTLLVAAEKGLPFEEVIDEKNAVTNRLNKKIIQLLVVLESILLMQKLIFY